MFVAAILQVTIFSQIDILGGYPDVVLLTLVAVALLRGSIYGAAAGFFAGLIVDTANLATLGVTSLLLTIAGYWIGRYGETTGRDRGARAVRLGRRRDDPRPVRRADPALPARRHRLGEGGAARDAAAEGGAEPAPDAAGVRAHAAAARGGARRSRPRRRCASLASTGTRGRRSGSDRFLPPDPRVESPYRFTPQLALRIGILGAVALLAFGVLFFRLWALQVLSGPQYLQAALDNQIRSIRIEAPRGQILDRNGRPLVINVPGTAVELHPADLPMTWAARLHELRRLSKIVHVPVNEMLRGIKARGSDPVTPVVVREDVKRTAPINYLYEHAEEFPGVSVTNTYIALLPARRPRRACPRLRERDLGRAAQGAAAEGLRGGRQDRRGRGRVELRLVPARARGARAVARGLARPAAQPAGDEAPAGRGRVDQADDRLKLQRAAAAGDPLRDQPGLREQALPGRRRRDRRARPARRLDPRDGLVPDLQPEHLHRARDDEAPRGGRPDALDRRAATTTRRSTAPRTASIRPARPSSR